MAAFPITHPDIDTLGMAANDQQFAQIWEPRGWLRVEPAVEAAADTLGTAVAALDDLTKPQLLEVAADHHIEGVSMSDTKDDIVAAIEQHPAFTPPDPNADPADAGQED